MHYIHELVNIVRHTCDPKECTEQKDEAYQTNHHGARP